MARLEKPLTDAIGTDFGSYTLVRRLGVGGTAETFEAIRHGAGEFTQRVCLKIVLPFFSDDEAFTRMFQREAMLAAKLRHRNIVGVIDFGEVDGRSFIAFELVDGIDLRTLLDTSDQHRLDPEMVALLGLELAAALVHAHRPPSGSGFEGLVHRDISPSNVLISRQGELMLTDFGVAKPTGDQRRKSSAAKGKFPYMSPEQLRGEPVDARSDLFSVGVLLFEALAGVRPYQGANDPATIMQILHGDHAELAEWAPDAPPKLRELIERMIQPDAATRPQTATELIEQLDEFSPPARVQQRLATLVEQRMDVERDEAREVSSTVGKTPVGPEVDAVGAAVAAHAAQEPELGARPSTHAKTPRRTALLLLALALGLGAATAIFWRPAAEEPGTQPLVQDAAPDEAARSSAGANTSTGADRDAGTTTDVSRDNSADGSTDKTTDADRQTDPKTVAAAPKQKALPAKPAHLDVIVVPWGDVWLNGKRWGAAPMMNEPLKPGRYRVSVGQQAPSETRTVRLRPGDRETLKFDLTQ